MNKEKLKIYKIQLDAIIQNQPNNTPSLKMIRDILEALLEEN